MEKYLIETPEQLIQFCEQIKDSPWLAVDTEFIREKSYYPKLCLLQVANETHSACIDPLCLDDLKPIIDVLFRTDIIKVFHACQQDLEIFVHLYHNVPSPIFDTQIAGALVGLGNQEGYASAVKKLTGIQLDKSQTRTNWANRPLDQKQLNYAHSDVTHLGDIYKILLGKLKDLNRLSWLQEDFQHLESAESYLNRPERMWSKVKGNQHLKGVQLAVLQTLTAWREIRAQTKNIPRKWVLSDDILLDLSKQMPSSNKNLSKIRGIPAKTIERDATKILDLIAQAQESPREQWPKVTFQNKKLTIQQEAFIDILMALVRLKAEEHNISAASLARRRDLELLVAGETPDDILTGWKKALIGQDLTALMNGDSIIRIQNGLVKLQTQ